MITIEHNFGDRATQFARYAGAWTRAVAAGLRDIAISVERAAALNLRGRSKIAGSYPVPVRTGNLRRSLQSRFNDRESMVIVSAVYARAIHQGFTAYGNPTARYVPGRPYLQDAIDSVDRNEIMAIRINKALPA
jgi:phage gpG-like protein